MTPDRLRRYARDPVSFTDDMILLNEKGQPWRLSAHQRRVLTLAFRWDATGRLGLRLLLWGEPKKSGKTFIAACLTLWWAFVTASTEIIVCANDLEQAVGRVFRTMVALCRRNPALGQSVTLRATEIQVSNGTIITAISSDYRGAAGSRHSLYVVDEPWGFISENAARLFEELTPPPTELNAWGLMTTTAGWTGESKLLESLYQRGLTGTRLDDDLELYQADELVMFWSHTPRQPWQTPEYYQEQARHLRPATYARLHRNEWVMAESTFITPPLWDSCIEPTWSPLWPQQDLVLHLGVDAAPKGDSTAVVAVFRDEGHIILALHRIWRPSPSEPLDFEEVEQYLLELRARYRLGSVRVDPYQMAASIQRLQREGVPIQEYPQTPPNLTRAGQALYELLIGQNLVLYPSAELREQALNTVALESGRGFRIAKEKASRKIDAIAALSFACVGALAAPVHTPLVFF